jgi:hypothetical protein
MYEIAARIDHLSSGVGCFDPQRVVHRLRGAFPALVEHPHDPSRKTYERIGTKGRESSAGALQAR